MRTPSAVLAHLGLALSLGLTACDSASPDRPGPVVVDGTVIEGGVVTSADEASAVVVRDREVVTATGAAGALDVYFEVELEGPGAFLALDLLPRSGAEPDVRLVQTRTTGERFGLRLDRRAWSGGADVEFVNGDRVVARGALSGPDSLGASDEEVESVHYVVGEDGKVYVVYDFTDGPPASVTPAGSSAPVPCTEIRVRPRDASWKLDTPVATLGGVGWGVVRIESEVRRAARR